MTRQEKDLQPLAPDRYWLTRIQKCQRALISVERHIPDQPAHRGEFQDRPLQQMDMGCQTPGLRDKAVTKDVIQMTMRIQQDLGSKTLLRDVVGQAVPLRLCITSRVDDGTTPIVVVKHIRILTDWTKQENVIMQHPYYVCPPINQ